VTLATQSIELRDWRVATTHPSHGINYRSDAKAVADYVGATVDEIQALPDYA
jgi:hypothetical protein